MEPRAELEKCYPEADFSVYFQYLANCKTVKSFGMHEHHICPRKQFPEFEHASANKIILTAEDHAHAHRLLAAAVPELCNISAWIESQKGGISARRGGLKGGATRGPVLGKWCVESGFLATLRTPAHQAIAGHFGGKRGALVTNHIRWHVKRNFVSQHCILCQQV